VPDPETAQAILDGTVPARSLNVPNPSRADLAEQRQLCRPQPFPPHHGASVTIMVFVAVQERLQRVCLPGGYAMP
jgi:hypothetical protein